MYKYYVWLQEIVKGISVKKKRELLNLYGDPEKIFNCDYNDIENIVSRDIYDLFFNVQSLKIAEEISKKQENSGIKYVVLNNVAHVGSDFLIAYYKGRMNTGKSACVVGTRKMSSYGKHYSIEIAKDLGKKGYCINSGLALGIDCTVQKQALDDGRKVQAFMAGGLDKCYPYKNLNSFKEIVAKGAVISPFPIGVRPKRYSFLLRNKLMCAFSDMTVLIEAPLESGAVFTTDTANEIGKQVFAVASASDSPICAGNRKILNQYAKPYPVSVYNPENEITSSAKEILDEIRKSPISTDRLIFNTKYDISEIEKNLLSLSCKDLIALQSDSRWHYNGW